MFSRAQNWWAVTYFTFFYFYVPVCGIMHEHMWITWLSTEARIKEPFGSSKMMPRFLSLSASTALSGFYNYCKSARVTHLLTLHVYRNFNFCNIYKHIISVCALYVVLIVTRAKLLQYWSTRMWWPNSCASALVFNCKKFLGSKFVSVWQQLWLCSPFKDWNSSQLLAFMKSQFVPYREQILSPLQAPTS
jgi:hypothetical protein